MRFVWYGQSCFQISSGDSSLVIDPYGNEKMLHLPPLPPLEADAVYCSHEHTDHANRAAVTLTGRPCALKVNAFQTWHDDAEGAVLGPNLIHVIEDGAVRAVHLGDLGHMPDGSLLERIGRVDVLLVNVGGFERSEARFADELCRAFAPRVVIPMHYRGLGFGYEKMGTVEEFTALRDDVVCYPGNCLDADEKTPPQTAVLKLTL